MTISTDDERAIAARLIEAYDGAHVIAPITRERADFDVAAGYRVLAEIERRRIAQGWTPVGRKIGFTNTTIWERYGVYQPMWARVWSHTVHWADHSGATLSLRAFSLPRLEPEVVLGLGRSPQSDDLRHLIECVDWIAPGFEIVQSHFHDWKFEAADCTAAFGLHGALVVGDRLALTPQNRTSITELLPRFHLSLRKGDVVVDRGIGSNVLGGPLHALAHLVRVLAAQPEAPPLGAGEIVTTGTISDAWPVAAGEHWSSDYGELPLSGLRLSFT